MMKSWKIFNCLQGSFYEVLDTQIVEIDTQFYIIANKYSVMHC